MQYVLKIVSSVCELFLYLFFFSSFLRQFPNSKRLSYIFLFLFLSLLLQHVSSFFLHAIGFEESLFYMCSLGVSIMVSFIIIFNTISRCVGLFVYEEVENILYYFKLFFKFSWGK